MGEANIEYPILSILRDCGKLTTSGLKIKFRDFTQPTGINSLPLLNRNDEVIDQIVRNIVSHRSNSKNNMIYRGFINYDGGFLSITKEGIKYLGELSKRLYSQSMR